MEDCEKYLSYYSSDNICITSLSIPQQIFSISSCVSGILNQHSYNTETVCTGLFSFNLPYYSLIYGQKFSAFKKGC